MSVQWRGENEREPARYGKAIAFGNLRDKGTAYMSYSDRVGPGIVVLGAGHEVCDLLTDAGFTALAPELPGDADKAHRLINAAIDHLLDNWHPRVGMLAFGASRDTAALVADGRKLDAVALCESVDEVDEDLIDDFRYELS